MQPKDTGPAPFVVDIEELTLANENFRTAVWTGKHFQMTLMTIPVGGEVGLEVHPETDQFLRLEQGEAKVLMGPAKNDLRQEWKAPPHHPHGTVHRTHAEAEAAEEAEHG